MFIFYSRNTIPIRVDNFVSEVLEALLSQRSCHAFCLLFHFLTPSLRGYQILGVADGKFSVLFRACVADSDFVAQDTFIF